MTDHNVVMQFRCIQDPCNILHDDDCKLVSILEHGPGLVCRLTLARNDGSRVDMVAENIAALSGAFVRLVGPTGEIAFVQRVMVKPWRYDQMMRGYLNTENSTGSVTHLPVKSV